MLQYLIRFFSCITRLGNPNPSKDAAFGTSVAGIGDMNGDGIRDLIVGAPGLDKVYVFWGKDQSVLRMIEDPDGLSGYQFGFSVVDVGDWDGDGIDDFAVGAPGVPGVMYVIASRAATTQGGPAVGTSIRNLWGDRDVDQEVRAARGDSGIRLCHSAAGRHQRRWTYAPMGVKL